MDLELSLQGLLGRIEAKLDLLLKGKPSETVDVDGGMVMTGAKTKATFHRQMDRLGVFPYVRGKYRRTDIENAMARAAYEKALIARKQAAQGESLAESRRKVSRPNPHDD